MDTFHTRAAGAAGPPRTDAASGRDRASQLRSPTMAWCAAASPSVSVTGGQVSNTCPGVRSSKAGPRTVTSAPAGPASGWAVVTSDARGRAGPGSEHRGELFHDGDQGR